MLKLGIIGYGGRASGMAKSLAAFGIPYAVTAISDPRAEEIRALKDPFLRDTIFYKDEDELLEKAELDGVMVGTRCHLHTPMAVKVARRNIPLFLEKPVAITFGQLKQLDRAFRKVTAPVVVSFPLRLSTPCQRVKQIIESGEVGTIEHVVAFNDATYGESFFASWFRNYEECGGLFLQKATHDLDYIHYLIGQKPRRLAAMKAQRVYGGNKPFTLKCKDCGEQKQCPESPFNLFYQRAQGDRVQQSDSRMCLFARGIRNEDIGNCIIEYENGAQASYTQNFFVRNAAGRRGARLYGYKGTIDFDWEQNQIKVFKHQMPTVETIQFGKILPHFGGDRELAFDFVMAMKEHRPSRSPLSAGILSALTCLWARQSAETGRFCDVTMPR